MTVEKVGYRLMLGVGCLMLLAVLGLGGLQPVLDSLDDATFEAQLTQLNQGATPTAAAEDKEGKNSRKLDRSQLTKPMITIELQRNSDRYPPASWQQDSSEFWTVSRPKVHDSFWKRQADTDTWTEQMRKLQSATLKYDVAPDLPGHS